MDKQEEDWLKFVAKERDHGRCEYSGLRATECVATICDCFETMEGALEIEKNATRPYDE